MDNTVFVPSKVVAGRKIYFGDGAIESLPTFLNGGTTGILCGKGTRAIAEDIARAFRPHGIKVYLTEYADEFPDYVRYILGVGAGRVAEECKRKSRETGVPSSLLLTAPTTDTILTGEGIEQVFIDARILKSCPKECLASGWGIVLTEELRRFEEYFNEKVLGKEVLATKKKDLPTDEVSLAIRLLELSADRTREDSATVMAKFLRDVAVRQGVRARLVGEYRFVSAGVLYAFYQGFLSSPSIDCLLPPDHDGKLDEISALTGRSRERLLKTFDFLGADDYFRINYILSEYRLDLLDRLKAVDFRSADKKWRRLYSDAGYWLKSAFTCRTLLKALTLSSEIGDGLLRYVGETGYADAMLSECRR